jgi:hypothetical protein
MSQKLQFQMPSTYESPLGLPLHWLNEVTGVLPAAVMAFVGYGAEPDSHPEPTADQLALTIAYLGYFIDAPCWRDMDGQLDGLRADAKTLTTFAQVNAWIMRCLKIGIDPL